MPRIQLRSLDHWDPVNNGAIHRQRVKSYKNRNYQQKHIML